MTKLFGWDKGLDYITTYKTILQHYKNAKTDTQKGYDAILLTQLRNGSRVSESIAFLQQISKSPKDFKREAEIKVLKSKNKTRLMILPEEFTKKEILRLHYVFADANKYKVAMYCKRTYGFNTHALRYAFISYLAKKGVSPQLIAKITGHSNLNYILHYTSKIQSQEILRNLK